MKHYIGLDVSMKETFVCTIDHEGKIINESSVPTEPAAIAKYVKGLEVEVTLMGLESGSLSHWLTEELANAGLPVKCIDARHCSAILSMRVNKTDRNDARGLAEVMRCNLYREVQIKTKEMREVSTISTCRKQMVDQRAQLLMSIRGILKPFGIRLGSISKTMTGIDKLRERVLNLELAQSVIFAIDQLITQARAAAERVALLDREMRKLINKFPQARQLMSAPGIGPVTALRYLVDIGDPERFKKSRDVGAYVGLTPKQYSSGETQKQGRISKCGSKELRSLLVEAAVVLLTRTSSWSKLKHWGLRLAKRSGMKKAASAVARKLAVIMHRMLITGEKFRFGDLEMKTEAA